MRELLLLAVVLLAIISCQVYEKPEAWEFSEPDTSDTSELNDTTQSCLKDCEPTRKPKLLDEGYISFHFQCEGDDPNEVLKNIPKDRVEVEGNCWTIPCSGGGSSTFCFKEVKDATATTDG